MRRNLLKIINHYRINNQQRKFNEEAFELQETITTYELGLKDKKHIAEEIADCEFILEQFKAYYEIPNCVINKIKLFKKERQSKRMENGE